MIKVCKFGGTALAGANNFLNAKEIILRDKTRNFVVVSAPGKRFEGDVKLTDVLINFCSDRKKNYQNLLFFHSRIKQIIEGTTADSLLLNELNLMIKQHSKYSDSEIIALGEYFSAKILAKLTGYKFVDSAKYIVVKNGKVCLNKTLKNLSRLKSKNIVMPGFYGKSENGKIGLLNRGGSDSTAAVLTLALKSRIFEKWTDVDGVYMENQGKLIGEPLSCITYKRFSCLGGCSASLLSPHACKILCRAKSIVLIKNYMHPCSSGCAIY